jgi:hypothetical protein
MVCAASAAVVEALSRNWVRRSWTNAVICSSDMVSAGTARRLSWALAERIGGYGNAGVDARGEQDPYGPGVGAADGGAQGSGAFGPGTVFQEQTQACAVAVEHGVVQRARSIGIGAALDQQGRQLAMIGQARRRVQRRAVAGGGGPADGRVRVGACVEQCPRSGHEPGGPGRFDPMPAGAGRRGTSAEPHGSGHDLPRGAFGAGA